MLCIVSISIKKNCNVISAGAELCACDPHRCGVMYLWFLQVQAYVQKKRLSVYISSRKFVMLYV